MPKTNGPKIKLDISCFDCQHEHSESYRVQSDSGSDVFCTHPTVEKKRVGDTNWRTPDWCPLLQNTLREFLASKVRS